MDSYVKLKNEVVELQNRQKNIESEKINILMPLYEIEKTYKQQLGDILPKNINSAKQRNLDLRISVLEEEIKDLELEYEIKTNIISKIERAKQQLEENKKEEEKIKIEIAEKEFEIQKRKEYVLSKIHEKEQIESEIKKTESKISEYHTLQEKKEWEKEIVDSIDKVLKRLWNELEIKIVELDRFLNDMELMEDIKQLSNKMPKTKQNLEEDNSNKIKEPQEENSKEEEEKTIEQTKKVLEDSISLEETKSFKEKFEEALLAIGPLEEYNDNEIIEENTQKEKHIEEQQLSVIEENQELKNGEIKIMEELDDEEELEQFVEDVYNNKDIKQRLIDKKERIALGISTIITKIIYRPKKIVNKSNDLIREVKNLVDNNIKKLTQEEVNDTVITASKIKQQKAQIQENEKNKEYNNYRENLNDLKYLNEKLEQRLNKIYLKEEFNIQDKPNARIKLK